MRYGVTWKPSIAPCRTKWANLSADRAWVGMHQVLHHLEAALGGSFERRRRVAQGLGHSGG